MSYADVTAKNAHQSPEEARANPVPELEHTETTSTTSLVDVDSPHVSSVPSTFEDQSIKTRTQADRIDQEQEVDEQKRKALEAAKEAKKRAETEAKSLKAKAQKGERRLRANADNPVVLGNAVLGLCLAGALGYGTYSKYRVGELSWKVVGFGAAVLGAFGIADYYASQYLFKKYPPRD